MKIRRWFVLSYFKLYMLETISDLLFSGGTLASALYPVIVPTRLYKKYAYTVDREFF